MRGWKFSKFNNQGVKNSKREGGWSGTFILIIPNLLDNTKEKNAKNIRN